MAVSAKPAVYICLQLSNAPRGLTESKKKTPIHLSRMNPRDLLVTLSPKYINNTYRDKCAQVHGIRNRASNVAAGICITSTEAGGNSLPPQSFTNDRTSYKSLRFRVEAYWSSSFIYPLLEHLLPLNINGFQYMAEQWVNRWGRLWFYLRWSTVKSVLKVKYLCVKSSFSQGKIVLDRIKDKAMKIVHDLLSFGVKVPFDCPNMQWSWTSVLGISVLST